MTTYAISRERFASVLAKNSKLSEAMFAYMRELYAD